MNGRPSETHDTSEREQLMSYITNYTLEHNVTEDTFQEVRDQFNILGLVFIFDDGGCTNISWYEHEADLIYISTRFPEFAFTLTGIGEAAGDMWKKRFQGGKVEEVRVEIVWPEFEELTDDNNQ